jgi:hypothetical protein
MELQKKKEALRQGIGGGPADIPTDVPMIAQPVGREVPLLSPEFADIAGEQTGMSPAMLKLLQKLALAIGHGMHAPPEFLRTK